MGNSSGRHEGRRGRSHSFSQMPFFTRCGQDVPQQLRSYISDEKTFSGISAVRLRLETFKTSTVACLVYQPVIVQKEP